MVQLELKFAETMLAYLVERPFKEVAGGINTLQAAIEKAKQPAQPTE